ncbi:hypothetical protein [Ruegeria arenilitoris]|uniref:hypothetical protein n=1 Tax=Ruegeria arenilitoris TaxID=1173585 RepID=UPI00147F5C82|nr:hypothetical protein [Ruegeria arenilitoris]
MAQDYEIKKLKTIAKKIARSKRIEHHEALNLVAHALGYSHWYAVSEANKEGWLPSAAELDKAAELLEQINPSAVKSAAERSDTEELFGDPGGVSQGVIASHPYQIEVSLDEVYMSGRGWLIHVPEAPSKKPCVKVTDKRYKANPINEPDFVVQALAVANAKAEQVRARIASDWPRRSTNPDDKGRVSHPINGGLSDTWFCLHCDEKLGAKAVAANLWHCPSCSASPIDIFNSRWWPGEPSSEDSNSA